MTLPLAAGTTLATIPAPEAYLEPPPDLTAIWRARLAAATGRKIGIVWRGNPAHPRDRERSMPPGFFAVALNAPGIDVISLQIDGRPDEFQAIGARSFLNAAPLLTDYEQTAALIVNLDLVISVDTSVCHLAAALGRPTWTLVDSAADWRWMRGRDDCPWYPTMRLFRQASRGDWAGVCTKVQIALSSLCSNLTSGKR